MKMIRKILVTNFILSGLLILGCTESKTPNIAVEQKLDPHILINLKSKADNGDKEALSEFCDYIKKDDLYDWGDYKVDEDVRTLCAELK